MTVMRVPKLTITMNRKSHTLPFNAQLPHPICKLDTLKTPRAPLPSIRRQRRCIFSLRRCIQGPFLRTPKEVHCSQLSLLFIMPIVMINLQY